MQLTILAQALLQLTSTDKLFTANQNLALVPGSNVIILKQFLLQIIFFELFQYNEYDNWNFKAKFCLKTLSYKLKYFLSKVNARITNEEIQKKVR